MNNGNFTQNLFLKHYLIDVFMFTASISTMLETMFACYIFYKHTKLKTAVSRNACKMEIMYMLSHHIENVL